MPARRRPGGHGGPDARAHDVPRRRPAPRPRRRVDRRRRRKRPARPPLDL